MNSGKRWLPRNAPVEARKANRTMPPGWPEKPVPKVGPPMITRSPNEPADRKPSVALSSLSPRGVRSVMRRVCRLMVYTLAGLQSPRLGGSSLPGSAASGMTLNVFLKEEYPQSHCHAAFCPPGMTRGGRAPRAAERALPCSGNRMLP